ncbi:phosphotransferase enzyme family protein [Streptomyces sp. NPDC088554]|uniref:phosphotransferase enzyme family protein n=2 Tax=unclassified Streptomyces TaxID=2593676 RepID=UPI00380C0303
MTASAAAATAASTSAPVVRALDRAARDAAHQTQASPSASCRACGHPGTVLADRADGVVVRHGQAVAKAHADGTDPVGHRARIAMAGHPALAGILLPPLPTPPLPTAATGLRGRPVTVWPYGTPVDPENPEAAPWEAAGTLLARLHSVPLEPLSPPDGGLPAMRGPVKAALAVARMRAAGHHPAAAPVERAWRLLPAWARGEGRSPGPYALCHGDLHLGQLVRHPAPDGPWLLIDVDDLGTGDPAWDLARPAAWYAAGLLPPEAWARFLGAYRGARGPAVPASGDLWPRLDVPARALTVQGAALAIAKSVVEGRDPDGPEELMIDACARMAALATELAPGASP